MKHYNKPAGCLFCLLLLLALPSLVVLAQQASGARQQLAPQQKPIPANRPDSVSYAFGVSLAQDLKQRGLEQLSPESVAHAIRDVYASHAQLTDDQLRELITVSLTEAMEKQNQALVQKAHAFMEENKKKTGIQHTASGLQYEILKSGEGDKPGLDDTVKVHYKGMLADGKQFDSSYDRGQPATFQLGQVIEGWQEGLQLMSAGAHYRLYIPYQLGYGERGAGPDIPPYSPLIFEVELLSISKTPAPTTSVGAD